MNGKKTYRKPPIIERIVGVYTDIKSEVFESRMPEWATKIRDTYPISKPVSEWSLDIKEVDGVPIFQNAMPKAEIIQIFWKQHPNKAKVYGMRLRPSRLVFHLVREDDNVHDFVELYAEMETWLGKWMQHFDVPSLKGVTLEYVNLLNAAITPQFMLPDGRLNISEAFTLFANIPGRYGTIMPPYSNKIRLIVDKDRPCYFDVRVRAEDQTSVGVQIVFATNTIGLNKAITDQDSLAEIRFAHDVMLEQFDCFFSQKARESFIPYGIPDTKPASSPA